MKKLFSIGHSTRKIEEFTDLLRAQNITQLIDIRTIPKSRHNPQYGQVELEKSLAKKHIKYVYLKELGGLRPAVKESSNTAWRNKSFRNYADYMQSGEFEAGLQKLMGLSQQTTSAIMCAEAVPWRCHRSLVSDALLVHDITVDEIIGSGNIRSHTLTSFAIADGTKVTYPESALEGKDD